jgi:hypothetical protein
MGMKSNKLDCKAVHTVVAASGGGGDQVSHKTFLQLAGLK